MKISRYLIGSALLLLGACKSSLPENESTPPEDCLRNVIALATDERGTCALDAEHRVYCWGDFGRLDRPAKSSRPVHIESADGASEIGMDDRGRGFARMPDGKVMLWPVAFSPGHFDDAELPEGYEELFGRQSWRAYDIGVVTQGPLLLDSYCTYDDDGLSCSSNGAEGVGRRTRRETASLPGLKALAFVNLQDGRDRMACALFESGDVRCYSDEAWRDEAWRTVKLPRKATQLVGNEGLPPVALLDDGTFGLVAGDLAFVPAQGFPEMQSVSADNVSVCGISLEGEAWCGTVVDPREPLNYEPQAPSRVDGVEHPVLVVATSQGGYAVERDGCLKCWGLTDRADCGLGGPLEEAQRRLPTCVASPIEPDQIPTD